MLRRLALVLLTGFFVLLAGPAAQAAPPSTTTNTAKGLVETFVDVVPTCEGGGPLYTITTTSNAIEHETVFDDGRVHATFTSTGTFTATPLEDPEPAELHRQVHPMGWLQRQRVDGERHVHFQRPRDRLGRLDLLQPERGPLQPAPQRNSSGVLPLPLIRDRAQPRAPERASGARR